MDRPLAQSTENLATTLLQKEYRMGRYLILGPLVALVFALVAFYLQRNNMSMLALKGAMMVFVVLSFIGLSFLFPVGLILFLKRPLHQSLKPDERSGRGDASVIPPEIKGWSWAGVGLGFQWGMFHSVWISILSFVPVVGLLVKVYLGLKGRELAWQKTQWASTESFLRVQKGWDIVGATYLAIQILTFVAVSSAGTIDTNKLLQGVLQASTRLTAPSVLMPKKSVPMPLPR
jgi:hypothetical protein